MIRRLTITIFSQYITLQDFSNYRISNLRIHRWIMKMRLTKCPESVDHYTFTFLHNQDKLQI